MQATGVGKVPSHVLDDRVRNVLNLVNRCAAANIVEYAEEKEADTPETAALLRRIGGDSIVLMKNEGNILPLKKDKKVCFETLFIYLLANYVCIDSDTGPKCQSSYLPWRRISLSRSLLCSNTI